MTIASSQISHIKRRRLPYDAMVSHLTSTAGAYVNAGSLSADIARLDCRVRYDSFLGSYKAFFGAYLNEQCDSLRMILQSTNNSSVYVTANRKASGSISAPLSQKAWHDLSVDCVDNKCTIDGASYTSATPHGTAYSAPLVLFGLNSGGAMSGTAGVMIASCAIYASEGLVRDYVAVRFTNGAGASEGALYDRVSGQLFCNAGPGSLVPGPDVAD